MVCKLFGDHSIRSIVGILASSFAASASAWAPPVIQKFESEPASFEAAPIPGDALGEDPTPPAAVPLPGQEGSNLDPNAPRALPGGSANTQATPLAAPAAHKVVADAATLKGVQPGRSTRDNVENAWGPPKEIKKTGGAVHLTYQIEPFKRVAVVVIGEVVSSIVIHLENPLAADALAQQLRITDVKPVQVLDAQGKPLGQAFPERGILFGYPPGATDAKVSQVVLEPIDALPFVLRAEYNLHSHLSQSLADLEFALQLDPNHAHAFWVKAEALAAMGDFSGAAEAARQAATLDDESAEYALTWGKMQLQLNEYDGARREFQKVIAQLGVSDVAKARAYCQLGDCFAAESQDFKQALQHHMQAIKLAETLTANEHPLIRRTAMEVLVDAHLAVAHDIAWGRWSGQANVVPKWLDRAADVADDLVKNDSGREDLLLRVSAQALAALAGLANPPEPTRWTEMLREQGAKLTAATHDPAVKDRLAWQLGVAYYDAMQVSKSRNESHFGLQYGEAAAEYLNQGQGAGGQLAGRDYLLGRLYYSLGAIHAIDRMNHQKAVVWFDKAAPLLEVQNVDSAMVDSAQQGEAFVSMAVSYWEVGGREQAMRLTKAGANLMERAVKTGKLERSALGVAYSNLASMHEDLGDAKQAKQFAEMAAKYEEPAQE